MTNSLPRAHHTASPRGTAAAGTMLVGCRECGYRAQCGGLDDQQELYGCFLDCRASGSCDLHDWTCPCKVVQFHHRTAEVGSLSTASIGPLPQPQDISLPMYVPMVRHGHSRRQRLAVEVAALSPFDLLGLAEGKYTPNVSSREHLLKRLRLSARARIMLVSVAKDPPLERYWHYRREHETTALLARLGPLAMTVPNFSFFLNAPRPHTLWNIKRMLLVAEEISAAGIPAIIHLNAVTTADWKFWTQFLRERPQIKFVAKEFQTGLKNPRLADAALSSLRALQDTLGRAIHPVIIGGRRLVPECARMFENFTIVDSTPFMKTVKRQLAYLQTDGDVGWVPAPTPSGTPVDQLLSANIRTYEMSLALAAGRLHIHRQLMLPLEHSPAAAPM